MTETTTEEGVCLDFVCLEGYNPWAFWRRAWWQAGDGIVAERSRLDPRVGGREKDVGNGTRL